MIPNIKPTLFLSLLLIVSIITTGCGSANITTDQPEQSEPTVNMDTPVEATSPTKAQKAEIIKEDLNALIEKGPAYVLAMVQTDSYKENNKFIGFEIVSFRVHLPAFLDLRVGDVITKINGLSIERPENYFEVFETLKTAEELTLQIIREEETTVLKYPIVS